MSELAAKLAVNVAATGFDRLREALDDCGQSVQVFSDALLKADAHARLAACEAVVEERLVTRRITLDGD